MCASAARVQWPTIITTAATHVFICILVASCLCTTTECIRVTRIHTESDSARVEALLGSNLTLRCPFELEGNDQLYSIKWHKKLNGTYFEFYSYILSPRETIHHKTLPGIRIDSSEHEGKPNGEELKIVKVDLDTEGIFRCEAVTDETFQVVRAEFELAVFIPARQAPNILVPRRTYGIGERVLLTCTTGPSRPVSQINWFINDIPVPDSYIRSNSNAAEHNATEQSSGGELSDSPRMIHDHRNERSNRDDVVEVSSSDQSVGGEHRMGHTSSQLDFILRQEHLTESGHFTVRCMSSMNAQFYPEVRNAKVDFGAWQSTTPVIIGLAEEYQLGDWVHLNCTVPAFQRQKTQSRIRRQGSKMEWHINGKRADRKSVIHYFTYGHVGLRFQLQPHHLTDDSSLSIKCISVQMWPADRITQPSIMIESLEEKPPQNRTVSKLANKGHRKKFTKHRPQTKPIYNNIFISLTTSEPMEKLSTETETTVTELITDQTTQMPGDVQDNMESNDTGNSSILDSFTQFGENHPQVITSLKLTLIPIAVAGAFFAVLGG